MPLFSPQPTGTTTTAGDLELDGTAGDIQALGAQAAGSTSKAADAGHVHPTTGVVLTTTNQNVGGVKTFNASNSTGAITTLDITLQPNPGRSTSASMFLDNTAGQIWEFFCNSGGQFGIYDGTAFNQVVTVNTGCPAAALSITSTQVQAGGSTDLAVTTAGHGLRVKEGSNAKQGTATLSSGSVVVGNTSVTSSSRIFLTSNADGGTPGWLRVSARSAGTSFTITSSSGSDTSTVAYQIFEPG